MPVSVKNEICKAVRQLLSHNDKPSCGLDFSDQFPKPRLCQRLASRRPMRGVRC